MTVIIDDEAGIEWGDYKIRFTVSSELLSKKSNSRLSLLAKLKEFKETSTHIYSCANNQHTYRTKQSKYYHKWITWKTIELLLIQNSVKPDNCY